MPCGSRSLNQFGARYLAVESGDTSGVVRESCQLGLWEPPLIPPLADGGRDETERFSDASEAHPIDGAGHGVGHMRSSYTDSEDAQDSQSEHGTAQLGDMPHRTGKPARTFWDRLLEARRDRGLPLTQASVARELGLQPSAVTKYVNGKLPELARVIDIAQRHGVAVEWLLSERGPKHPLSTLTPSEQKIITLLSRFPAHAVEDVLQYVSFRSAQLDAASELTETGVHRLLRQRD